MVVLLRVVGRSPPLTHAAFFPATHQASVPGVVDAAVDEVVGVEDTVILAHQTL